MVTVHDLLEHTMLAAAFRGWQPPEAPWLSVPDARWKKVPEAPAGLYDKEFVPIWDYEEPDYKDGKVRIGPLKCRVSGMNYMPMPVCESIEWGHVTVCSRDFAGDKKEVTLPLEEKYRIRKEKAFLRKGYVPGSDTLWRLLSKTDKSFEYVFGYEFPWQSPSNTFSIEPQTLSSDQLLSSFDNPPAAGCVFAPGAQDAITLRSSSLRVVVVVTLVCCKEADYGLLNAGRFYPMIMVATNQEVETVTGRVTLARPPKNYMPKMGDELMNEPIRTILFTDRNEKKVPDYARKSLDFSAGGKAEAGEHLAPNLAWDQSFDYYELDPYKAGESSTYVMAFPQDRKDKQKRAVKNAEVLSYEKVLDEWNADSSVKLNYLATNFENPKRRNVTKMAGEGEFDNIHLAPTMRVEGGENLTLTVHGIRKDSLRGLDAITMAPFCIHDCMHMHVRWTNMSPFTAHHGWDGDTPNALPGAPLVPPNQRVTLKLLSPFQFEYRVEAHKVKPGKWQIMLHHGAAYSLSDNALGKALKMVSEESGVSAEHSAWGMMYWNLAWVMGTDNKQHPRLFWEEGTLEKLRAG
jgi:hypothetical protein